MALPPCCAVYFALYVINIPHIREDVNRAPCTTPRPLFAAQRTKSGLCSGTAALCVPDGRQIERNKKAAQETKQHSAVQRHPLQIGRASCRESAWPWTSAWAE